MFDWAITNVLHHEGGWVNDPDDPGGATNCGISLRYLQSVGDLDGDGVLDGDLDGDGDVDIDDIRMATDDDLRSLYHQGFWLPNQCDKIKSELLAVKIFDMCVNMGSKQAWKLVQRAKNGFDLDDDLVVDGIVGDNTLNAINSGVDYLLIGAIRSEQARFYGKLITQRPVFEKYRLGWLRRAAF